MESEDIPFGVEFAEDQPAPEFYQSPDHTLEVDAMSPTQCGDQGDESY